MSDATFEAVGGEAERAELDEAVAALMKLAAASHPQADAMRRLVNALSTEKAAREAAERRLAELEALVDEARKVIQLLDNVAGPYDARLSNAIRDAARVWLSATPTDLLT